MSDAKSPNAYYKTIGKSIAQRVTNVESISNSISDALTDAYAHGFSDGLAFAKSNTIAERFPKPHP